MPETTDRFEDLPILRELREDLIAAAHTHESNGDTAAAVRWLLRRTHASVIALVFALAGGAIAVAATGLLNGSPVKRQGPAIPNAGFGLPAPGGSRLLALRAADPHGGLPWGMRVVHTTRGEICVQIGRLNGDQIGQLGIDGAFHDDGRFHPLAPDVLPDTSDSGDVSCNTAPIRIGSWPSGDRSAAPNGPEETSFKPTAEDLRSISWGLLGPHALSVTYSTTGGMRTSPVAPGSGAYLIVSTVSRVPRSIGGGGEVLGWTSGHEVASLFPARTIGSVMAATFQFGSFTCSVGQGAPVVAGCPRPRPTPESRFAPTRTLNEPVRATLRTQPQDSCSAAFLVDPCYRAEIAFRAPYPVTSAGSEYFVRARSSCDHARASSWSTTLDIQQGQTVNTRSTGLFNCTSDEFEVLYLNNSLPAPASGSNHESVVVGTATLNSPAVG